MILLCKFILLLYLYMSDFKYKYNKYKKKYLNLLGGFNVIKFNDESFMNNWIKQHNFGQFNCGIFFIKDDNDKIVKCEDYNNSSIIQKLLDNNIFIFPKIYEIIEYNKKYYTIMEKLDGDLTSFLFNYIPNKILNDMNLDKDYYKIFYEKIPKTFNSNKDLRSFLWNNLYYHIIYDKDLRPKVIDAYNKHYDNQKKIKNKSWNYDNLIYDYNGEKLEIYYKENINLQDEFDYIDNKLKYYNNLNLKYDLYVKYFDKINNEINLVLRNIMTIIKKIKLLLLSYDYEYFDNKFDNFAYKIIDKPNNFSFKYHDLNIEIRLLDWSSGLFLNKEDKYNILYEDIDSMLNEIIKENYNDYSIFGQYELKNVNSNILGDQDLPLSNDMIRILKYDKKLEILKFIKENIYL